MSDLTGTVRVQWQAWSLLHSDEVEKEFKSQENLLSVPSDCYERHLRKRRDPYLETREKKMLLWNAS